MNLDQLHPSLVGGLGKVMRPAVYLYCCEARRANRRKSRTSQLESFIDASGDVVLGHTMFHSVDA